MDTEWKKDTKGRAWLLLGVVEGVTVDKSQRQTHLGEFRDPKPCEERREKREKSKTRCNSQDGKRLKKGVRNKTVGFT